MTDEDNRRQERLLEAEVAILSVVPDRAMNITVLNKALFYADLTSLLERGKTITEETYLAFERGPVVRNYQKRLVEYFVERGLGQQIEEGLSKPVVMTAATTRFGVLDELDLKIAATIATKFARKSSLYVTTFAHKNPGWRAAYEEGERIGKARPIDMVLAMQQLAEHDDWLDTEFTTEESKTFDIDDGALLKFA